jgi:hypothetical protein
MRTIQFRRSLAATAILALAPLATPAVASDDPAVMLRVEVNGTGTDNAKVKVSLPLSLIEVVVESVDTSHVMRDLKTEKGIDLKKLWHDLKNANVDEFITVEKDNEKVKVYKERDVFRVTIQEEGNDSPNIEVRIPFSIMDYLTENHDDGIKLSEMVAGLKAQFPLTIVEAHHDGQNVKVWLEQK